MVKVSRRLGGLVGLVAMCIGLGGLPAVANAGQPSVAAAVRAQNRSIKTTAALHKLKHIKVTNASSARKVIRPLRTLKRKFDHAATVVSHASATTSAQRTGRREWCAGVRRIAHGYAQMITALADVEHGHKSAAKQEVLTAVKTVVTGAKSVLKADRALGVTPS